MGGHHLVLGKATDYLTGNTVTDTLDERIRQKIARFLVEKKGYAKSEIDSRIALPVTAGTDRGTALVDFAIRIGGVTRLIIRFGPGSLVSRQRAALAAARLLESAYAVPYAAVTNGEGADTLETRTGKVIRSGGLDTVFSKPELMAKTEEMPQVPMTEGRREKESRILFALDVLTRRECESYTCRQC